MLNDTSRFARDSAFFQMLAPGLALGGVFVLSREPRTGVVLVGIGFVAILAWMIGFSVLRRRLDARLRAGRADHRARYLSLAPGPGGHYSRDARLGTIQFQEWTCASEYSPEAGTAPD